MSKLKARFGLGGYLLAAFIAACAYKILITLHIRNIDALTSAAFGVIEGKPHWLAYQNRLLGPYLLLFISKIGLTYADAWKIYSGLFLLTESLLLFHLLKSEKLSDLDSIKYLVLFLFCFLVLQNYWFYTWDSVDLVIFTLFAYGVVDAKPSSFYILLFVVGILNRESALFIAVFLLIDAFGFSITPFSIKLVDIRKSVLGSVLLVSGVFYTKYIRYALFVSKPNGQPDTEHEVVGNQFHLLTNLKDLFGNNFSDWNFIYSIAILTSMIFFAGQIRNYGDREFKCFLMLLIMIANIFVFGIFNETRVHFILLPFMLFLWIRVTAKGRVTATGDDGQQVG